MKRFLTRRRLIAAVAVVGVLAVAGLVFADWLTSGSGSGYAKAGANQSLSTIDVSASATTLPNPRRARPGPRRTRVLAVGGEWDRGPQPPEPHLYGGSKASVGARRVVSSTGTYAYRPTMCASATWAAAIVAYKAGG